MENCIFSRGEKKFPGIRRTIVGIFLVEKKKRRRRKGTGEIKGAVGMLDAFSRGSRRQFRRFNLSRIGRRCCVLGIAGTEEAGRINIVNQFLKSIGEDREKRHREKREN